MANTNLVGMKYLDMPQEYRDLNSKSEFKEDRTAQKRAMVGDALKEEPAERMAGDRVFELIGGESFKDDDRNKLVGRIERMEDRIEAGKDIDPAKLAERQAKLERFDRRAAAQEEFDGTLDSYNFEAQGAKENRADLRDIEFLASRGYSADDIEGAILRSGAETGGRAQKLLDKYKKEIIADDPTPTPDPTPDPQPEIEQPTSGVTSGGISPVVGSLSPNLESFNDNIVSNPAIYGDTGDITMGDGNRNYGTINTGIINDIRDYGGGYGQRENNTGLAQTYIDQMEENWSNYSGPGYGAMITDFRTQMADDNNPINTAGLYQGVAMAGQNMYDKGLIQKALMYGDPYKMPSASYGGFPQLGA